MATTEDRATAAGKAASRQEQEQKQEAKPASPRKRRPKTIKLPSVAAAIWTDQLPEPARSGAIALARGIYQFFRRVWQELSGAGAVEPPQLPARTTRDGRDA